MNVLLSIKPVFAYNIFTGKKKFEYRRTIFKEPVDRIIVYASSPVKMVIGEFSVKDILFEDLDYLWCKTKNHSGITKEHFYSYFYDKDRGYAIKVGKIIRYQTPSPLHDLYGIKAPQSFAYIHR
jgi:predicted transcriptional regulator